MRVPRCAYSLARVDAGVRLYRIARAYYPVAFPRGCVHSSTAVGLFQTAYLLFENFYGTSPAHPPFGTHDRLRSLAQFGRLTERRGLGLGLLVSLLDTSLDV